MPGMMRKPGKGDGSYMGPEARRTPKMAAKGNPKRLPVSPASEASGAVKAAKAGVSRKTGKRTRGGY